MTAAGCIAAAEEAAAFIGAAPDQATLDAWLARREQGEPPGWIIGTVDFCDRTYRLDPGVYVPRAQTERLARLAASMVPEHGTAIDLCTGSGVIAAHILSEVPSALVVGVDVDERAARCAGRNGVPTIVADLAAPIADHAVVDVVTAVAPYVPTGELRFLPADVQRHEPRRALDGGGDGLDLVRRVVDAAGRLLRVGGRLVLEIGGDQDEDLSGELTVAGFEVVVSFRDDEGDLRGIVAELTQRP